MRSDEANSAEEVQPEDSIRRPFWKGRPSFFANHTCQGPIRPLIDGSARLYQSKSTGRFVLVRLRESLSLPMRDEKIELLQKTTASSQYLEEVCGVISDVSGAASEVPEALSFYKALITEYLPDHKPLDSLLKKSDFLNLLNANENALFLSLAAQLIAAVLHLHRAGIVHGYIKPSQVLVRITKDSRGVAQLNVKLACSSGKRDIPSKSRDGFRADNAAELAEFLFHHPDLLSGGNYTQSCDIWSLRVLIMCVQLGGVDRLKELVARERVEMLHEALKLLQCDKIPTNVRLIDPLANLFEEFENKNFSWSRNRWLLEKIDKTSHQNLANRFEDLYKCVVPHLASGRYSYVHKFQRKSGDRFFAVKTLTEGSLTGKNSYKGVERECKLLERLNHPNIVRLEEVFEEEQCEVLRPEAVIKGTCDNGQSFEINAPKMVVVLEYCDGGTLEENIRAEKTSPSLSPPSARGIAKISSHDIASRKRFIAEIVCAVTYLAKQGIFHRDLKPANILLSKEVARNGAAPTGMTPRDPSAVEPVWVCKIADLNLSAFNDKVHHLQVFPHEEKKSLGSRVKSQRCGTAQYMAPENFSGDNYDHKVDMWSLGLIIYFILFSEELGSSWPREPNEVLRKIKSLENEVLEKFNELPTTLWQQSYKELVCGLVTVDVGKRWGVCDVWMHYGSLLSESLRGVHPTMMSYLRSLKPRLIYANPPSVSLVDREEVLAVLMDVTEQLQLGEDSAIVKFSSGLMYFRKRIESCEGHERGDRRIIALIQSIHDGALIANHPHIVQIADVQASQSAIQLCGCLTARHRDERNKQFADCYVEYCRGEDLLSFVKFHTEASSTATKLPDEQRKTLQDTLIQQIPKFIAGVFLGLMHMHAKGFCHGHVTVARVLLSTPLVHKAKAKLDHSYLFNSAAGKITVEDDVAGFIKLVDELLAYCEDLDLVTHDRSSNWTELKGSVETSTNKSLMSFVESHQWNESVLKKTIDSEEYMLSLFDQDLRLLNQAKNKIVAPTAKQRLATAKQCLFLAMNLSSTLIRLGRPEDRLLDNAGNNNRLLDCVSLVFLAKDILVEDSAQNDHHQLWVACNTYIAQLQNVFAREIVAIPRLLGSGTRKRRSSVSLLLEHTHRCIVSHPPDKWAETPSTWTHVTDVLVVCAWLSGDAAAIKRKLLELLDVSKKLLCPS
jgi:serine/threonine protein kinase